MRSLIVGLLMLPLISFAQNSMFWNHYSVTNPAATGLVSNHYGFATYSFFKHPGPISGYNLYAGYDAKLASLHGGLGLNVSSSKFAWFGNNSANLNYSLHQKIGEKYIWAFGIGAGMLNIYNEDFDTIYSARSETQFNLNLGTVFKGKNSEVGFSITQLNRPSFGDSIKNPTDPTYFLYGQYKLKLSEKIDFIPRLQYINYTGYDELKLNVTLLMKKQYWFGIGYSHRTTFSLMAGVDLFEKFRLGYSIEVPSHFMAQNSFNRSEHSFALAIMLGRE